MAGAPTCDHDELDRFSCPVCGPAAELAKADPEEAPRPSRPFVARFDGACPPCGYDVRGRWCVHLDGRTVHVECT